MHRRTDQNRSPGSQQRGREQIVGQPSRVLGQNSGSGWGDHDQVRILPEFRVGNRVFPAPEVHLRWFGPERVEGQFPDESESVFGENGRNERSGIDEASADFDGLVRGNASAHAEDNPLARDAAQVRRRRRHG